MIYGKWENFATEELPLLDACGGHWGYTPDSPDVKVYHYHVQPKAPFTLGCFGPNADGSLVTVDQCRSQYSQCGDGDEIDVTTSLGTARYDLWCPCYDANGSNVSNEPLAVFSSTQAGNSTASGATGGDGDDGSADATENEVATGGDSSAGSAASGSGTGPSSGPAFGNNDSSATAMTPRATAALALSALVALVSVTMLS